MKVMVVGQMTAGKSSVANHLINLGYKQLSLAGSFKEIIDDLDSVEPHVLIDHLAKYWPPLKFEKSKLNEMAKILEEAKYIENEKPKPRKRLQHIGTQARQRISDQIWIESMLSRVSPSFDNYVCDDVRFVNEFESLRNHGWVPIILVVSPEVQDKRIRELYGNYDPKILEHPSETDFNNIPKIKDYVVDADAPLDEMLKAVDKILKIK